MLGWQRGLARIGIHTPFGRDAVGAALVLLIDLGNNVASQALAPAGLQRPLEVLVLQLALIAVADAALAWRRRAPRSVLGLVIAMGVISSWVYAEFSVPVGALAPLVAAYTVGAYCRRRSTVTTLAVGGVTVFAAPLITLVVPALPIVGAEPAAARAIAGSVLSPVMLAVPAVIGAVVVRQREARARQAVTAERGRIARELHDVAAHHLSSMVVQAGAAERQIDSDPEEARQVLAAIREQGSTTLAQMRQIVGALREDEGDGAAPPTLRQAQQLVDQARGAGCQVSLQIEGQRPSSLPPTADFAGYRVLQESLTNARRHAPGATVIARVAYGRDAIEVEVGNTAPPADALPPADSDGHGLAGMRERVSLAGGELTAGPTDEGGWRVHAVLPSADTGSEALEDSRAQPDAGTTDGTVIDAGAAGQGSLTH